MNPRDPVLPYPIDCRREIVAIAGRNVLHYRVEEMVCAIEIRAPHRQKALVSKTGEQRKLYVVYD